MHSDVDVDVHELPGHRSRVGDACDCPAQIVGRDVCAWCGGTYPPLDEVTRQAVERVRARVADNGEALGRP